MNETTYSEKVYSEKVYDVVICGSGLAGLTLARQLKQTMPDLSILTIDKLRRPLPEVSFKVGESTVEVGACYLADVIGLKDYIEEQHYPKLGLRYFFGDGSKAFEERPELGLSKFHTPASYQMDRGKLENDLRQFNTEQGIEILENCSVQEINLAEDDRTPHQITYRNKETKEVGLVRAKWAIDAMGRRRYLQRKLDLAHPRSEQYNAAWFWVDGRLDVTDFVCQTQQEWHDRVPDRNRYLSTNHLCGHGYWVWLIPLSTNATSIGIVAHEKFHSFSSFNNYEKAFQWLEKHESALASRLVDKTPKKFMIMPKYSYTSDRVLSSERWACAGEAGTFPDPFYSPGTDFIGFGNSLITHLIQLDRSEELTKKRADWANRFFLSYQRSVTQNIQNMYHCFGNELIGTLKILWDTLAAWAFSAPLMFSNALYLNPQKRNQIYKGSGNFFLLTNRVQYLFRDWSSKSSGKISFGFIDYLAIPFVRELRERNLQLQKPEAELTQDHLANIELFEDFAQAIFIIAVADALPQYLEQVLAAGWINVWAISLEPERWEQDGLFKPKSSPRNLEYILEPLQEIFQIEDLHDRAKVMPERELEMAIAR